MIYLCILNHANYYLDRACGDQFSNPFKLKESSMYVVDFSFSSSNPTDNIVLSVLIRHETKLPLIIFNL